MLLQRAEVRAQMHPGLSLLALVMLARQFCFSGHGYDVLADGEFPVKINP